MTPAQAGVKYTYLHPLKVIILPVFVRLTWKQLQLGTGMLLIITSTSDELFNGVNIDDLE